MSTAIQQPQESRRAYKPKKTLKPPAIQSAILAKRANGSSKAKIAKELGMAINTVTNVLELNDFDKNLQTEQAQSLKLIPKAIQVAHDRLSKGSENMAIHVLENTIWPLQSKTSKPHDPGLTLAIQNLMGNVQVNAPAATTNSVSVENPASIVAVPSQVIENKEQSS
jgi:hypothetical protein